MKDEANHASTFVFTFLSTSAIGIIITTNLKPATFWKGIRLWYILFMAHPVLEMSSLLARCVDKPAEMLWCITGNKRRRNAEGLHRVAGRQRRSCFWSFNKNVRRLLYCYITEVTELTLASFFFFYLHRQLIRQLLLASMPICYTQNKKKSLEMYFPNWSTTIFESKIKI